MNTLHPSQPQPELMVAKENALKAIDLLVDNQVAPLPLPYAVAYEYWVGMITELHQAIDRQLREGKSLDEYFLRELYEQYLAAERFSRVNGLRDNIQSILRTLMEALEETGQSHEEFGQTLRASIPNLTEESAGPVLRQVAEDLLQAVVKVETSNRLMHERLEQARQETDQLRIDLEQQRRESLIDPLTGLYNRRAMEQFGDDLLSSENQGQLTLLALDIDLFKSINDTYGHAVGDVVIRQVADTLRKCIRGDDVAIRYGGEEFVVLLPNTSLEGAMIVAETIRHRIEALRLVRRTDNMMVRPFTISIGVSCRRPADTWDDIFQRADEALYRAKESGRNRVIKELG